MDFVEEIANVWPKGGLFAFSGVDGETCHAEPFVAAGTEDGIGWRFWLEPKLTLLANVGRTRLTHRRSPTDFCLSDCWHCSTLVNECEGCVEGAFVDRASMAVRIAFDELPEGVFPELAGEGAGRQEEDITLFEGEGWWVAVCARPPAPDRKFGIAISFQSEREAIERARGACAAGLDEVMKARLAFYESVPVAPSLSGNNRRAYYKAVSVHKVNIESAQGDIPCRWTTPDRMPHRHMWLWDTAFHSLGLYHVDPELGEEALRALFAKQRDDGKLLLAAQPGPAEKEEQNTQPPIVAWALCRQFERSMHADLLNELYPDVVRYVEWFEANRRNDTGLYGWEIRQDDHAVNGARGGESGMDNSPRFDDLSAITAVDLSSYLAAEYHALEKMARYLDRYAEAGEWHRRRTRIAEEVNELLWDDEDRFYYDLDENGAFVPIKTTAGLMPLLGEIPDRDRAEALRVHLMNPHEFWAPFPAPSVSQDEASFSNDMWRGPTWANVNALLYDGLMAYGFLQEARQLAHRTISEITRHYVMHGCFYEYYDSTGKLPPSELPRKGAPGEKGGVGFGVVADLQWTAAAFVHLAHELG